MSRFVLALILFLALSQQAISCRGPFSIHNIHISREHQVYLGKVVSLGEAIANAGTLYESKVTLVQFEVIRAWQPNPPTEVSVANVESNAIDQESCVRVVRPRVGDEWLVVATQRGDTLYQSGLMGLRIDDQHKAEVIQTIGKFRAKSFLPKETPNK